VPDLTCHQVLWDDSHCFASRPQHGVREHTHQTHISAAINQPCIPAHEFRTHRLSGSAVFRVAPLTGTAEDADSFHADILKLAFVNARLNARHFKNGVL
jgi:hypothetical protein